MTSSSQDQAPTTTPQNASCQLRLHYST
ncbi:hypothetical protein LINPERHAP1_LOCUS39659 [Linum perenne]